MTKKIAYLALMGSTLFWGANFNLGKIAVKAMHPLSVAAWRFAFAATCMVALLAFREGIKLPSIRQNLKTYLIMGVVGIFGFNAMFFFGLRHTSPVNGSLIMALNPTLTVIMASLVASERITLRQIVGLSVSLCGVIVVVTGASFETLRSLQFSLGDLLILIGNVCWAAYSVIGRRFLKGSTPLQTSAVTMVIGALLFIALAQFQPEHNPPLYAQGAGVIGAVVFMALLGTVLAYFWWNIGIAKIGASKTAVFFDLVPIWTMLLAVVFGQTVTSVQVGGSVLVVSGVLLSSGIQLFPGRSAALVSGPTMATAATAAVGLKK